MLHRPFSTSPPARASILFALNALSNSRETQHFNKLTRLPRTEHSPPLKLIQTGEIIPYPLPSPPPKAAVPRAVWPNADTKNAARVWDEKALNIGRALLSQQAQQTSHLQRSLARAQRRHLKADKLITRERQTWQTERKRLRDELRTAGICILLSIGAATALATWRFWPGTRESAVDSGELGRRIAARAAGAMPLPAAVREVPVAAAPRAVEVTPVAAAPATRAVETAASKGPSASKEVSAVVAPEQSSWWQGLFWKQ
ncbi:uncharacterized protein LTR77_001997 [Saxophila tyrrhenica]|uniref:Uncharacterized protein n=1 Tax=Saxophila tyrrhenica TaxID=1690608 RepID=A0AAV9PJ32_9PEZI|nr:hypothetical protein LTR77_001997 [Saxophila tyrrhenica]